MTSPIPPRDDVALTTLLPPRHRHVDATLRSELSTLESGRLWDADPETREEF
ncbi:hypothetical protein ABIB15_001056 [Marisediminicola sp. UYEF4]|uniref:hypothetical protein n=1 Tax=Marisediminicola sp. UYEF4 TaxID=1756384 RepID=UPI003395968F